MIATIQQHEISGETIIPLDDGYVLIASKSRPGAWYQIHDGECSCPGFHYRGRCRHIAAVIQAQQTPCFRCGALTEPSASGAPALCGPCSLALTGLDD